MSRCHYSLGQANTTLEYRLKNKRWTKSLSRTLGGLKDLKSPQGEVRGNVLESLQQCDVKETEPPKLQPYTYPLNDLTAVPSVNQMLGMLPLTMTSTVSAQVFRWKFAQSCRTVNLYRGRTKIHHPVAPQNLDPAEFQLPNPLEGTRFVKIQPAPPKLKSDLVHNKQPKRYSHQCLCSKCVVKRSNSLKTKAMQAVGIAKITENSESWTSAKYPCSRLNHYYSCNFCLSFTSSTLREIRLHINKEHVHTKGEPSRVR